MTNDFRNFLERTLYHGTIIDNELSIKQFGLYGQMGDFQTTAGYRGSEDDEVVFMASKESLSASVTAMVHHISRKLGKDFHDVTDDDIRNHGLLCIMYDIEKSDVEHRPEEDERGVNYPSGSESGDYYAANIHPDKCIKGAGLIRLLKRYGEWPRDWGKEGYSSREKLMKGMLSAGAIREHPGDKEEILQQTKEIPKDKLIKYMRNYVPQWQR